MQIWVKTQSNMSDHEAHLTEHCVLSWHQNEKTFLSLICTTNWTTHLGYTIFSILDTTNIKDFIHHITNSIDVSIINKEKKILKDELQWKVTIGTILKNKIWKMFFWKNFSWYKSKKTINEDILSFHHNNYNKDSIWILDDNFSIINRPNFKNKENNIKNSKLNNFELKIEWESYKVYPMNYCSISEYTLCYFLEWLYDISALYIHRYKWNSYESPISHFIELNDKLCFVKKVNFKTHINKEFFEEAKNTFITNSIKLNEISAVHEILQLETISITQIKEIVSSFNYSFIKKILEE